MGSSSSKVCKRYARLFSTRSGELTFWRLYFFYRLGYSSDPLRLLGDAGVAYDVLDAYGVAIEGEFQHFENINDPKAYLNVLLFDKSFNLVDAAYRQIYAGAIQPSGTVKTNHDYLVREVSVAEPGYAFIFFSNEDLGRLDVHFDDVKITHTHSNVVA